jgi:TPR repeat protein
MLLASARSGDPEAQFELGIDYVRGRGVREDAVTGYSWLTLALANGNNQAERVIRQLSRTLNPTEIARIRWNLGEMYADGTGVRPDKVTAYMWHLLAELAGETRSRDARARLARNMTADQRLEARARASEWLRKHHQPMKKTSLPAT